MAVLSIKSVPVHRDLRNACSRHTVLVVENEHGQVGRAQSALSGCEHWLLDVAETAEAALSLIATRRYCAVLVDERLPDGNALAVLEWAIGRCPVIVMAHEKDAAGCLEILHLGAYDCITKDDQFELLLPDVLNRALQKHSADCELAQLRTDLQAQNRQLTRTRADLRSLESLKSELMTDASNEIQQPLNLIRRLITLLEDGSAGDIGSVQKEYLSSVLRNCDLLELLIGDVFQLQGLETGNHPVRRYKVRARTLVDTTVKRIIESYPLEGRKLTIGELDDDIVVLGDSELLAQSIQNLIEAALAFTSRGGAIVVACRVSGSDLVVEITSDGPAMTYAERRKVWDRFESVVARSGQNRLRTGLELAIARSIMERHDGKVVLRSEPSRGNTFSASLPLWNGKQQLTAFLKDRMSTDPAGSERLAFSVLRPHWGTDAFAAGSDERNRKLLHHIADSLVTRLKLKPDNIITIVPENVVAVLTSTGDSGGLMVMHKLIDRIASDPDVSVPIYCSTVMVTSDIAAEDWIAIARNRAVLVCPSAINDSGDQVVADGGAPAASEVNRLSPQGQDKPSMISDVAVRHVLKH